MDINEPLTENGEYMFCEKGNFLAGDVIEKTRKALKNAISEFGNAAFEGEQVKEAIRRLYVHAGRCDDCQEN